MNVNCDTCNVVFDKLPKEIRKSKHNFCSHSCSAKFTNKARRTKSICPSCSGDKDYKSKLCRKCASKKTFNEVQLKQIKEYFNNGNARVKYSAIRRWALTSANNYNIPNECSYCGFNIHTEVYHIKPISKFPETSLMGEVNSKDNLIRLCPNHHIMMDKGLITPAEARTRKPSD